MYACSEVQAKAGDRLADGGCTPDCAAGTVERRDQAVPRALDEPTAKALKLAICDVVVGVEELPPRPVASFRRQPRRIDEIGEEESRKNRVRFAGAACARHEFLDL